MASTLLALASLPFAVSRATANNAPGVGPGSVIEFLRDASTVRVEASYRYRLYVQPGADWVGPPADGLPTDGAILFRDAGKAWRVEHTIDASRVMYFGSIDSSFDGDFTRIQHDRGEHRAVIWHSGEESTPLFWTQNPFHWLAIWADGSQHATGWPITRNRLASIPEATLDLANDGWTHVVVEGETVDQNTIVDPMNGLTFVLSAPVGKHDQLSRIDRFNSKGVLDLRVRFDEWKLPTWGEGSALTAHPLPFTVTVMGFAANGTPLYDVTLSVTDCSIDLPIPADELTASLEGAETIIDGDTNEPIQ
jgi:hypothetical protein